MKNGWADPIQLAIPSWFRRHTSREFDLLNSIRLISSRAYEAGFNFFLRNHLRIRRKSPYNCVSAKVLSSSIVQKLKKKPVAILRDF